VTLPTWGCGLCAIFYKQILYLFNWHVLGGW